MSVLTEIEATRAAKKLLSRMEGRGWKIRVWENIGWHYAVETSMLSVRVYPYHSARSRFCCMLKPHYTLFGAVQYARDPNHAVESCLAVARDSLGEYISMVDQAFTVYAK